MMQYKYMTALIRVKSSLILSPQLNDEMREDNLEIVKRARPLVPSFTACEKLNSFFVHFCCVEPAMHQQGQHPGNE